MTGRLVVIEGIDGAGTTTQARRLVAALGGCGRAAVFTREPSDGPIGKLIREMLTGAHAPVTPTTMALLFAADRADHLGREIEPALARGEIVVSDRYYHSSLAYQGTEEDRDWISVLNRRARRPDLTVLLELPAEVAAARRAADNRSEEIYDALATQRRVAAGYRAAVERLGATERIEVLDGTRGIDDLAAALLALVLGLEASP